ncbi:NAD(P)H-dependent flavin oxidoreductase [Alcaligenes sp. SDU_A2]|uniref:NAD(P)H-dependent flavin oxidoreductase n=1 Tax=Alcaligenes sp. SDU_A2 TaxID=3136634 RepID=UPI00311D7137
MYVWPNNALLDLLNIEHPIIQSPMAGAQDSELPIAVARAGGLGSLPCAMLGLEQIREQTNLFRQATSRPLNLNFFCHQELRLEPEALQEWRLQLMPYYQQYGLDPNQELPKAARAPFSHAHADLLEELRPEVVSFHFGLPAAELVQRVKKIGALVISSATTVAEAVWLQEHGADIIIAQGAEAGGHRGLFLGKNVATQVGSLALLPQIADAVDRPVVAAGGIADGRGIAAAMALGACATQIGTAYLFCPEAKISDLHRQALSTSVSDSTAITNLFTGRPARGIRTRLMDEIGPLNASAPVFPHAGSALSPLRIEAEKQGRSDFTSLWSGQSAPLGRRLPAEQLTLVLAQEAQGVCKRLGVAGATHAPLGQT